MNPEQFDKAAFNNKTTLEYKGFTYRLAQVDFEERLFGLQDKQLGIFWVRCENVEVV